MALTQRVIWLTVRGYVVYCVMFNGFKNFKHIRYCVAGNFRFLLVSLVPKVIVLLCVG